MSEQDLSATPRTIAVFNPSVVKCRTGGDNFVYEFPSLSVDLYFDFARELERENNQLRAELRETTMLCEAFCQSHTSIGLNLSELRTQLADEKAKCEGLEKVIVRVDDCLRRIEETRWGHDGCCGVTQIANLGREIIDAAMKQTP